MESLVKGGVQLKGCFRIHITDKGKVVGDSGWIDNLVTNDGIEKYIAWSFGGSGGALAVSHISIGTGGVPASNATALPDEIVEADKRVAVARAFTQRTNITATATMQFAGTFASGDGFITTTQNISNIGLFNSNSGGILMAGNTYESSALATNQNVEVSYQIRIN